MSFLNKVLNSVFGSKSERDIKILTARLPEILAEYNKLQGLSHDQLRARTQELKALIADELSDFTQKTIDINAQIEANPKMDMVEKSELYKAKDKLIKDENAYLEEVLDKILPQAFAIVKETARRFKENAQIEVTATEFDRNLAARKPNVTITENKAFHNNTWLAAGTEVKWDMVHYDVQLIGGMVLHQGKIAEMATGEGKTLVGTLPAFLNALAGKGVHIVTVNDYLARRDSQWNGPIFEFHGLSVDCIDAHQPNSDERRAAYNADITYGTNNEFGFDYLRDNMARSPEDQVQRRLHFAMVDEVDSVLIDDARTPLIISGPVPKGDQHEFHILKPRIERLVSTQKAALNGFLLEAKRLFAEGKMEEAGLPLLRAFRGLPKNKALIKFLSENGVRALLQKTENYYMQDNNKEMPKVDAQLYFTIDEKNNSIELTEKGIELITASGEDPQFFVMPDVGLEIANIEKNTTEAEQKLQLKDELMRDFSIKSERIHSVNQLLKAYCLFEADVEYIIDGDKIKIVDEQTGRIMEGRRYSDGLHQAIEAKENVKVEDATQTHATVTLQNYFRMYHKLCGMTGTASTEAGEFWEIYKLDVVDIPTNRDISRKDHEDFVYKTVREKYNAVAEEVEALTKAGRPVLVGTTSVENSELISRMLKLRGIKHNVLNAKQHQREADIVAEAGQAGTVTIATNMAGRGTDIKLGAGVKEAGGLAIVGTERHESRRVDRQLRGRAGRQGDPGSSQFFVSLDDDLMRMFGSQRIASLMDRMGMEEGENIQHSMITSSIERAQRKVEENNFGIRKRLLEYDDVMNAQRNVIYTKRNNALFGERLDVDLDNVLFDVIDELVAQNQDAKDVDNFRMELIRCFSFDYEITQKDFLDTKTDVLSQNIYEVAKDYYTRHTQKMADTALPVIKDVYQSRGETVSQIVIPYSDGIRTVQLPVDLKKAYISNAAEVVKAFERNITLMMIDDAWKEHLREMDELKQSVQNAVYEQKDPLLIYKFESFELFKRMIAEVNQEIISFLFKAEVPIQTPNAVQEAAPAQQHTDMSRLKVSKPEYESNSSAQASQAPAEAPQPRVQPIRVEQKIGRNDLCPCGSGKKYKSCHGIGELA